VGYGLGVVGVGGSTTRGRGLAVASLVSLLAISLTACEVRGIVGRNVAKSSAGGDGGETSTGFTDDSTSVADPSTTTSVGEVTDGGNGGDDETSGVRFDLGAPDAPASCVVPMGDACDGDTTDPLLALGINCPGGAVASGGYRGDSRAMTVHQGGLGASTAYPPREGSAFVVLSTGIATQLAMTHEEIQAIDPSCSPIACPSTTLSPEVTPVPPPPIDVRRVSDDGVDCSDNPELVGQGDCSNSLYDPFAAGSGVLDYAELRIDAIVPEGVDGLSYEFAFFSTEYPTWIEHKSPFNDMYVAWLESEAWTGNISFDELGNPISATGVLLDYKDAPSPACPAPCDAPELSGFSMEGHGATKWLVTTAPVVGGEQVSLLFAIFDLSDGLYDSMVALDHFEWTCSGAPPFTTPVG
jgi:hypothetical protein